MPSPLDSNRRAAPGGVQELRDRPKAMADAPPLELYTVASPCEFTTAVSGAFSATGCDNCIAVVGGGSLHLWSAPGSGGAMLERARETLPAEVCCQQVVRCGGSEMLFVLYAGLQWRLLQLDGAQLRERAAGVLEPPEHEPEETLFGCEAVVCCTVRRRRGGKPDCVLLAVWDRWLTVLSLGENFPVMHMSLLGAPGLPMSAGLPPRVVRLATWDRSEHTTCDSAEDPMGNPAVAVLYADDGLRLLSVQCINLDFEKLEVLPGPWGLQNIGLVEAEQSCDVVPLVVETSISPDVGPGVLVVGQTVVTYISGDGEQAAQIQISKLPGISKPAKSSASTQWRTCQVSPLSSKATGLKVLMVGGEDVRSPACCLLHIYAGSRAARIHCGSGGADDVEIDASKVLLPAASEPSQERRFVALVPGEHPGQVFGYTADGRVLDFSPHADGSVAKEVSTMTGWQSEERQGCCAEVLASTHVPLTRRLPGVSLGNPNSCASPVCETALAVCGVEARSGPYSEGGCVALGRVSCARVATTPAAASFPELPSTLHALLLPDGTALILCGFRGTACGTQIFSMREDGAPPVAEPELNQSAPTLAIGFMGRSEIIQVTDEALYLVPANGLSSDATASVPKHWSPPSAETASIGAAAVCESVSLVAVGIGTDIACCCLSGDGSDSPFEEVGPRFTCDGGQVSALSFYTPTCGHSDERSVFLAYAEWGSNRIGLLNALTMQPAFSSGVIVIQNQSLCRSIVLLESSTGAGCVAVWMLIGLADGQVLCYSTGDWINAKATTQQTGSGSSFVLKHTLCVGSSPVELHCVAAGSEPGQHPYAYASSSRDMVISIGSDGELLFADVAGDHRTLLVVPTNGVGGYGSLAWLAHPQPGGATCTELFCGYIDFTERLRWQRRMMEGHTPRQIVFHAPSQTLLVVTEAPMEEESDVRPLLSSRHRRQIIRVLDAENLEQIGLMNLDVGHTVDHLLTDLPVGLLPNTLAAGNEVLMMSSLYRPEGRSGTTDVKSPDLGNDVQSLLSVLRVTTSREHENARVAVHFSVVMQHVLASGSPGVVRSMCPFCDRHGDPVLAVVRGGGIEVLRLNSSSACVNEMGMESDSANHKAKQKELPVGDGAMNVTLVAKVSLGTSGGELGCAISSAAGYLLFSACSGPATGQSIFRWHDDLRLVPQLVNVSRDRLHERGTGLKARLRGAAVARLIQHDGLSSCIDNDQNIVDKNQHSKGNHQRTGVSSDVFAVVGPLAGGLRILRHTSTSELPLNDAGVGNSSAAPTAVSATAPGPSTVVESINVAQGQEPETEPEPTAVDLTADDLLAATALTTDSETQNEATRATDDLVRSNPYEMRCCFEQLAEGRTRSLRPVVGIHTLSGGRLGVRRLEAEDEVVSGLMVVRDDGTVQVITLPRD